MRTLFFSESGDTRTHNDGNADEGRTTFDMFSVLVYHLVRFSVAMCVYFTLFSFSLNLSFFLLLLLRLSSVEIHFSIPFVVHCLGDVQETHKHTYPCICISFSGTWHINGYIAGCHVFLSYVQCFQYAPNRSHWNQYRAEGLTTLHTIRCCFCSLVVVIVAFNYITNV